MSTRSLRDSDRSEAWSQSGALCSQRTPEIRHGKPRKDFSTPTVGAEAHSGMPTLAKLTVHPVGREGELGQVKMLQSPAILLPCQFCSIWLAVGPPGSPGPAELSCWVGIMARSSSCVPAVPTVLTAPGRSAWSVPGWPRLLQP